MDVAHQIVAERRRQISEEGWSLLHDDRHVNNELLFAALSYVCVPGHALWPWDLSSFHPSVDPVRNLVKAGALIAAEGDRLLRRTQKGLPAVGGLVVLGMEAEKILDTVEGLRRVRRQVEELEG